ncbi:MAG: nitrate reductase cytochrome c-type subunit [Thermodesulfobacteriota bacterium]
MKRYMRLYLVMFVAFLITMPLQVVAEEVQSLRGPRDVQSASQEPEVDKLIADQKPLKRDFIQQPPLIPHKTEGYNVTRRYNKCLSCHSWANHKAAGATKISPSHFVDRDGNELTNLSARRYFCTQCHVTQVDAPPLIENTFEPVQAIK